MPNRLKKDLITNPQLTIQGFWLYSPISILGVPVTLLIVNNNVSAIQLVGYGFALTLATFLIYFSLIKFVARVIKNENGRLISFIVVPAITGAARGLLFYYLIQSLNLNQPSELSNRVISSLSTTLFWLLLANYVVNVSRNFLFKYQAALNQFLHNQSLGVNHVKLSNQNEAVLGKLQVNLAQAVESFLGKDDPASFRQLSSALTEQINDQIRPLSRRIWVKNIAEFPVIRVGQLFKDSLASLNFSWPLFIALIIGLSEIGNLAIRSFVESIWRTGTFLVILILLRIVYDRLKGLFSKSSMIYNLVWLFIFGLVPVIGSELVVHLQGYGGDWLATILVATVVPALMIVLTLLRLTQQDRKMIIDILHSTNNELLIKKSNRNEYEGASIASFLHNSLQSELLALSKQLEEASNKNDPEKSAELLQRVSARVSRSIAEDFISFTQSPADRLKAVVDSWHGILDIKLKFNIQLLKNQSKSSLIVQIIEEFSTNVSRYDHATELEVSIKELETSLILTLQSNGAGKINKSTGLGTSWFDQVCLSPWLIEKNAVGTLLTIEI